MSHVETAPHECQGNLIFCENGLSPYWAMTKLLLSGFDGYSGEIETNIDGEPWIVSLGYQPGGIAPRLTDNVNGDRLYEIRVGAYGRGERKANFLIQPRFMDMRHHETSEPISSPFHHIPEDEGVNVRFSGSNLEPDEYLALLPKFIEVLSHAGGILVNSSYFTNQVHEMSNITTYERYVRLSRTWSPKLVGRSGCMHRLFTLCAREKGSKVEYRVDNEDIVGKNHRIILRKEDAARLISGHRYGKQIKHYHPMHVRKQDAGGPLIHPKVGVLLKKSLNGHAFQLKDHRALRREIDETLINVLYWSDIPIQADPTTFIADDHFEARPSDEPVKSER